jgi:hypothetical protein
MDSSIRRRLSRIQLDFLTAVTGGDDSLAAFYRDFTALWSDIEVCLRMQSVTEETLGLAHETASRIDVMADGLVDFHTTSDQLSSVLQDQVGEIFQRLHLSDPPVPGMLM